MNTVSDGEAGGFDDAYAANAAFFGSEPDPLLPRFLDEIPGGGRVLDLGAGQGRHALWLARRGYRVCAVDPSPVAVRIVESRARAEGLSIESRKAGFEDVGEEEAFDAVLVFGLLPLLDESAVARLRRRLGAWLRGGGAAFVTAFTAEESERAPSRDWFLVEPRQLPDLLNAGAVGFIWEGLGPEHRHGSGPPERHAMVEAVLRYLPRGD